MEKWSLYNPFILSASPCQRIPQNPKHLSNARQAIEVFEKAPSQKAKSEEAWAMNYYGRILDPAHITGEETGKVIKESLSCMYQEGRFLGGFEHATAWGVYHDGSQGDFTAFTGREWITQEGLTVYEGGLIQN